MKRLEIILFSLLKDKNVCGKESFYWPLVSDQYKNKTAKKDKIEEHLEKVFHLTNNIKCYSSMLLGGSECIK